MAIRKRRRLLLCLTTAVLFAGTTAVLAQAPAASSTSDSAAKSDNAPAPRSGSDWGPGFMMGPGMMRGPWMWGGRAGPCNMGAVGMAEWRADWIERALRPTEAQRTALNNVRSASATAAETLSAACPTEIPKSSPERLAFMEKRADAMLQAIKTIRPAFDAFYATLNDDQKSRLDAVGPHRWGWRWRWSGP